MRVGGTSAERQQDERAGERNADGHREDERAAVLHLRGPILLDPVDPVQAALDLTHRRGRGHQRARQAEQQREVAVVAARLLGLVDGVRQDSARRARKGALDRVDDDAADAQPAEGGREPDEGDEALHEDEGRDERQRAGVAEAVGGAQPDERVLREPAAARGEQRLPGVVAGQLPRLGDTSGGAHGATAGTQTVIAAGSTSTSSALTFSRSPPSSS